MSFEKKLLQMKGLVKKEPMKKQPSKAPERPKHEEKWNDIGLRLKQNKFGWVYEKKVQYPAGFVHGNTELGQLGRVLEAWEGTDFDHPFKLSRGARLVFFDTETTGLGGTGAYIFLAGILEETEDGFELTQWVLPDPSHEAAFLYETGFWQDDQKVIFSYNGKSFDWPQLTSRWTFHRNTLPKIAQYEQIDLFHGTKRIWKNELERMKLSSIEEQKLDFHRQGDVPGFMIPAIYLDAVKSGFPEALAKVLHHNELDILSLVALYIKASDLLIEDLSSETSGAYTNIGKWYADLKQYEQSAVYLEHVTQERGSDAALARFFLAIQKKRAGDYADAVRLFKEAAPNLRGQVEVEAWVHASKICEHQLKDLEQAGVMAGFAKQASEHTKVRNSLLEDIAKRLERIDRKRQKNMHEVENN